MSYTAASTSPRSSPPLPLSSSSSRPLSPSTRRAPSSHHHHHQSHSYSSSSATTDSPPASPSPQTGFLVRALHSFSPSTLAQSGPAGDQANSCLSFQAGDVIRCLNMDESGWWDGELLGASAGAAGGLKGGRVRGWFPRNYVEVLEDGEDFLANAAPPQLSPEAHTLLSSIEQNVGLLENAVRAGRKGHYQPSTACVISSIRTVLSATSSLTRDSPVLRSHPPLSSARKKILSSLASLVNKARQASAPSLPLLPDQKDNGEIAEQERKDAEAMLDLARATVECVRGFLLEAEKRGVEVNLGLGAAPSAGVSGGGLAPGGEGAGGRDLRPAKSMGNLRDQRRPTLEALQLPSAGKAGSTFPVRVPSTTTIKPAPSPAISSATAVADTFTPASTYSTAQDLSLAASSASSSTITPHPSLSSPSSGNTLILRTPSALSTHLSTLHDSLLSTVAALIGHVHSHARSSSPASSFAQLIDLTREGIERVRDCLVVVEKIAAELVRRERDSGAGGATRESEEMKVLAGARERLYEATTALVSAARIATSPSSPAPSPSKGGGKGAGAAGGGKDQRERDEEERKALLSAATGVLRAGGDCVGAVKLVVGQIAERGGWRIELELPRPRTSEELAEEAAMQNGVGLSQAGSVRGESVRGGRGGGESDDGGSSSVGASSLRVGGGAGFGQAEVFEDAPSGDESEEVLRSPQPKQPDGEEDDIDVSPTRRRNPHTLSMLGRKATSLGNLRGRFEADLRLEEADEDDDEEGDAAKEEERVSEGSGSTASVETARSELPPPVPLVGMGGGASTSPSSSPPKPFKKGHDRVKTSSISLVPSPSGFGRAPSPSPSATSSAGALPSPPPPQPSSIAMSRAFSSGSGHSARSARSAHSSSRATAASVTSTVASTAQTAETSPRNSFQSSVVPPPPSSASTGGVKRNTRSGSSGARSSLGSVRERGGDARSPPMPLNLPPSATTAVPSAIASPSSVSSLYPPRASTPDNQQQRKHSLSPIPASPSGRNRENVPWFLERDYPAREVSFNADGHVSGGTLRCLVERMTLHDTTIDASFSNTFLLTFRMFTTPLELARLLFARFDLYPPVNPDTGAELSVDEMKQWTASKLTPIRLRIYNLFKTWVEGYWLHDPDREIVDPLLEWCRGRLKAAMPSASQRLVDLVNKRVVAAEQAAAAASRSSLDADSNSPTNASTTSLVSQGGSSTGSPFGNGSMNGSALSLALSPTVSRSTAASSIIGSSLHRMQSTDRLKAGKPVVPFSAGFGSASSAVDSYSPSSTSAAHAPAPIVTKSLLSSLRPHSSGRHHALPSVVDVDALELARQLTIMESRVYGAIRPDELLGSSGASASGGGGKGAGGGDGKNANVRKMSALSTRLTGWIAETILGEQDQKRRTGLIKYFVKLGERLLALSNYNALFAVFTALNSSTIARLKRTWDGLAPKYKASFEVLRKATDHARNYAEYRQKIRQAVPPCLPFVGLFLTDLIFIFEGNRAERPSPVDPSLRLINFDRYHKMARIVGELQRFQVPYQLVEVPEIQTYLQTQLEGLKNGQDAQSLYRQSLLIEPRAPTGPSSSAASIHSSDSRQHHHRDVFNWRS